eukprot:GHVS01085052.1.p1 GENE.GHVS01085052.1~~GHVS01085052.1.p1  ORF type:complete len:211 (-),score=25.37 GHVS01085052.1:95-727(-)
MPAEDEGGSKSLKDLKKAIRSLEDKRRVTVKEAFAVVIYDGGAGVDQTYRSESSYDTNKKHLVEVLPEKLDDLFKAFEDKLEDKLEDGLECISAKDYKNKIINMFDKLALTAYYAYQFTSKAKPFVDKYQKWEKESKEKFDEVEGLYKNIEAEVTGDEVHNLSAELRKSTTELFGLLGHEVAIRLNVPELPDVVCLLMGHNEHMCVCAHN